MWLQCRVQRPVFDLKATAFLLPLTVSATVSAAQRPDIVLITTDDQGLNAGCYGDSLALTPNLDRLAAEGVLFEKAYVTQASCSPSRSSILTGLYPHQNGQYGLAEIPDAAVRRDIATLPGLLKNGGYFTGLIGKLHVKPADIFPFDYRWVEALSNPPLTRDVRRVAELTGEFLKKTGDRPFFLYLNYFDPHRPFDRDANQCKGLPEKPYIAKDVKPFSYIGDAASLSDVAAYYNCINRMDVGLGLVFDQLKAAGRYDNTIIIFISDNGADFTRAKTTCYEAGVHVPFIVKWPGVSRAGWRSPVLVSSVDILPTLMDASGLNSPDCAGRSLRDVLQGITPADWRGDLFAEYTSHALTHFYPRRSVREGNFKLIHNLDSGRPNPVPQRGTGRLSQLNDPALKAAFTTDQNPPEWELYDLGRDPDELSNLAGNPENSDVLKRLQDLLQQRQTQTADPLTDPAELQRMKKSSGL